MYVCVAYVCVGVCCMYVCVWFMFVLVYNVCICVLIHDVRMHMCVCVCVCVQVHSSVSPSLHLYLIVFETTSPVNAELINSAATQAGNKPLGATPLYPSHSGSYMPSYGLHFKWALGI